MSGARGEGGRGHTSCRSDHDLDLHDSMGQIGDYMESEGVRFVKECVPEILEKTDDGKIKVSAK